MRRGLCTRCRPETISITVIADKVYWPNICRYAVALRPIAGLIPLKSSERISVSSSALFTGRQPPWLLPAILHGVLNDLVEQIGILTH